MHITASSGNVSSCKRVPEYIEVAQLCIGSIYRRSQLNSASMTAVQNRRVRRRCLLASASHPPAFALLQVSASLPNHTATWRIIEVLHPGD